MFRDFTPGAASTPKVCKFPLTLDNINVTSEGPMTFKTKKELITYCRENKLSSGAL